MALNVSGILDAVTSHALALGRFHGVYSHEPKSATSNRLTMAVWGDSGRPIAEASGLAATTWRLAFQVRLYQNFIAEPQDAIDPALMLACDDLIRAYTGDFTLDGLVKHVDVLGAHGDPLGWRAGYITQDQTVYRVLTATLPLVVNDLYAQAA